MKNFLKLIVALIGLLLLAAPALRAEAPPAPPAPPAGHAEHGRGPGGPGQMMKRAAQELGLNADQQAKWEAINQQEKAAADAIRNDNTIAPEDKRAKLREANKPFADQRRAVLNPEQQKKFDEMRKAGPRGPKKDKKDK
jgi:Spy/CpxP family protein refolding chaperone